MKEYKNVLEHYKVYHWSSFTRMMPESEWGNQELAARYLEKYWVSQSEYEDFWKSIQDEIFINQNETLPKMMFNEPYEILCFRGGSLFGDGKDYFDKLKRCFRAVGNEFFVIIENTFGGKLQEPSFRMKFPTSITWEELMSGNYISAVLFEMFHKEYFVFGDSGDWGEYVANEYENPLEIVGFKSEYSVLFREKLRQSHEEWDEIKEWLPPLYRARVEH